MRRRLVDDGTADVVIERVLRPGFFANGDAGLVEFARKLGVLGDDEQLASE